MVTNNGTDRGLRRQRVTKRTSWMSLPPECLALLENAEIFLKTPRYSDGMSRRLITFVASVLILLSSPLHASQAADRIALLDRFVGVWDTADTFEAASGPVTERGVRRCARALKGTYVECTTLAPRPDGAEREYRFLLSWDATRETFTLIQLWSDVAGHSVTTMTPSEQGRMWDLRNVTPQLRGRVERRSWGTIQFEGADRMVWTGRANTSDQSPDVWRQVFREVSTRRADPRYQ